MKEKLTGVGVALITPFDEDKNIDTDSLKKLIEYNIDGGLNYFVVLGTTSEYPTLTKEEKKIILETVKDTNNSKLPIILCIGGNNTQGVIDEIKGQNMEGIDAILSPSPYYNKPSQEGIYQHYKAIAKNTDMPIIIYNVPSRTSSNILPKTTLRLANDFKNIIGIKEASGDIKQYMEIIKDAPKDFAIISGDDDLALNAVYNGGIGTISVVGQALIGDFSNMIKKGLAGDIKGSNKINYKILDIISLAFKEGNPVGIKEILKQIGIIKSNEVRLPLIKATEKLSKEIEKKLKSDTIKLV